MTQADSTILKSSINSIKKSILYGRGNRQEYLPNATSEHYANDLRQVTTVDIQHQGEFSTNSRPCLLFRAAVYHFFPKILHKTASSFRINTLEGIIIYCARQLPYNV